MVLWFLQIVMLLDPNSSIIKSHGKYAGPLAETEVSCKKKRFWPVHQLCWGKKKKKVTSPQGGSNSRPLVYETSALPLSYRGHIGRGGGYKLIYAFTLPDCTYISVVLVQEALQTRLCEKSTQFRRCAQHIAQLGASTQHLRSSIHSCSQVSYSYIQTMCARQLFNVNAAACHLVQVLMLSFYNILYFIIFCRDVGKAIVDSEHSLMYLNTLQPWFLRLHQAFNPDTIMKLFPPTIKTLLLVWQHSR